MIYLNSNQIVILEFSFEKQTVGLKAKFTAISIFEDPELKNHGVLKISKSKV